ncbi:MAG: DUF423 domain-containing protein [Lautropia sp.]|nr:DUF423 domain-containing protein [Lautropia sp.]
MPNTSASPAPITLPATWGALFAGLGVAAGAIGNHAMRAMLAEPLLLVYETAVRYQIYHALALLAVAALASRLPAGAVRTVSWLFIAGIICFSGSLYLLALTGSRPLGILTPVGGSCFIAGWLWLAWATWRHGRTTTSS